MATTMVKVKEKQECTNRQLADLLVGLYGVQELKGLKFAIQVSKNITMLKKDLEYIDEATKPTPEFLDLAAKVNALQDSGDQNIEEKVKALEEKNKKLVDARKTQIEEFNSIMEETVEVTLHKISEEHLPTDITGKQLQSIELIINM